MEFFESFTGLVAVVLIFGLPVIGVVMAVVAKMHKNKQQRDLRQLIIENHTDAETAKVLVDEPKKQPRKLGGINLDTLRGACVLLGLGFGALINWLLEQCGQQVSNIYFWLILAFGIGVGLLVSFLVEMKLYKKYGNDKPADQTKSEEDK